MLEPTSSTLSNVERITRSGSRSLTSDEYWTGAVYLGARVTMTLAGPVGYHSEDGSPPPDVSFTDGEFVIEGDHGPIYLYGMSGSCNAAGEVTFGSETIIDV